MSGTLPRDPARARLDRTVPARAPWSIVLQRGEILHIIDIDGQQAVDTLLYNAADMGERYSAQDTIAAQRAAYVTTGCCLLSNEGRVLATIVADSCGQHDTSAGACSCESNTVRFGHHTRYMQSCRENFLLEGGRYGLAKRDLVGNINFFMNVPILPDGSLAITDGVSGPGSHVRMLVWSAEG